MTDDTVEGHCLGASRGNPVRAVWLLALWWVVGCGAPAASDNERVDIQEPPTDTHEVPGDAVADADLAPPYDADAHGDPPLLDPAPDEVDDPAEVLGDVADGEVPNSDPGDDLDAEATEVTDAEDAEDADTSEVEDADVTEEPDAEVWVPCDDDDACGVGEVCEDGQCVDDDAPPCVDPAGCETGVCREGRCVPCDRHEDCISEYCGVDGQCGAVCDNDEGCLKDSDCVLGACRPAPDAGLRFERFVPEGLETLDFPWAPTEISFGFGPGMALVDIDDSGRPALFTGQPIGVSSAHACLWQNVSVPGAVAFAPMETWCSGALDGYQAGWGVDLSGDGRDALVLLGEGRIEILHFETEPRREVLEHPRLEPGNPHTCMPGAVAPVDLTFDGQLELVIGCQSFLDPDPVVGHDWSNLVLRRTAEGAWTVDDDPQWDDLRRQDGLRRVFTNSQGVREDWPGGNTLAIGVVDINDDGLPDLVFANDAFSAPFRRLVYYEQGHVLQRTPLDAALEPWTLLTISGNNEAWGSYMGVGQVRVGDEDHLYLSDWGPNRLLSLQGSSFQDRATATGAALGRRGDTLLFAWGVLVDDFSGNGLDDILVLHGATTEPAPRMAAEHRPAKLLVQREDSRFRTRTHEVGFRLPETFEEQQHYVWVWPSPRGGVRASLDGSGALHVVASTARGAPWFWRVERDEEPLERCQLRPRPRYAPGHATGFALAGPSGEFRVRDVQGQMRMAPSSTLLTPDREGWIRFPSGYVMPYSCDPATPLVVEEPAWLTMAVDDVGVLRIEVEAPHQSVAQVFAVLRSESGEIVRVEATQAGDGWETAVAADTRDVMVMLGERYLPRWWPIHALP